MSGVATAPPGAPAANEISASRRVPLFGPALIVAATGIGASDIIATSVAGARFGPALLWAVLLGAALKGVLAEGIARWQIQSGMTFLQGTQRYLPRWVLYIFSVYLFVWAVGVAAALANGCGLAIENLSFGLVSRTWGAVACVVAATAAVKLGHFGPFAKAMKFLIIAMLATVIFCGLRLAPSPSVLFQGLVPAIPDAAGLFVLSLIGGIGGSMTLLAYNYLPQQSSHSSHGLRAMRIDIITAYAFTALFAVSMVLIASQTFDGSDSLPADADIVRRTALTLSTAIGPAGFYVYSVGFLAAVLASLLGTWQTIPLLIADCYASLRRVPEERRPHIVSPRSGIYHFGLIILASSGIAFAFANRPLALIVGYTIVASFIVPFIAAVLLSFNLKMPALLPATRHRVVFNGVLLLILLLFLLAASRELLHLLR